MILFSSGYLALFDLIKVVGASQLALTPPPIASSNIPMVNLDGTMRRQKSSLVGGHDTCFLATVVVEGMDFRVQIDTGSTDTILPHSTLNGYKGPTINFTLPKNQARSASAYGDGSWWYGYLQRINVALNQTTLSALSPVYLMDFQSTSPIFAPGTTFHGLMGIAFPTLSATTVPPYTVMDAWVETQIIKENKVAFHGCPYSLQENSWIDFGNETAYHGCNFNQQASVMMPSLSYYNVDVSSISVAGVSIALSSTFQSGNTWSFLDSCTSNIMLPSSVRKELQNAIKNSGAISKVWVKSGYLPQWLNGQVMIPFLPGDLNWKLLPNISFTINTHAPGIQGTSTVTLTLGPRQYIQANTAGYYVFMVGSVGDQFAILGLPFFAAYHIVVDRDTGKISFQLGCGCDQATDAYPAISTMGSTIDPGLPSFAIPNRPIDAPNVILKDVKYQGGYSWQSKVYAPYINASSDLDILKMSNTIGTARYILGFITSDASDGQPSWNGVSSISNLANLNSIQSVRFFGGDVVISFGGPSGMELANSVPKLNQLIDKYQNVLYGYSASWLDFYLFGPSLTNTDAVDLRNDAIRAMQKSDPNPRLSYSLPVTPSGFGPDSINVLQSAIKRGVRVDVVNLLAMDFDAEQINPGTQYSNLVIKAAIGAHKQLQSLGMTSTTTIGITIKPGQQNNPQSKYFFRIDDAGILLDWSQSTKWVSLISIWNADMDATGIGASSSPHQFSKIFVQYEN